MVYYMSMIVSIMLLHFLAQMTPGPDVLLISQLAIRQNLRVAIYAVAGISLGIAVWIILTLTGLGVLLQQWAWFQPLIMGFGAIFLAKMGWAMCSATLKTLKNPTNIFENADEPQTILSHGQYLIQGLITNLINPKALIYFASVFSLALNSPQIQQLKWLLGIIIIIETFIVFVFLAWILSNQRIKPYYQKYHYIIDGLAGVLFLGFAIWLAWQAITLIIGMTT